MTSQVSEADIERALRGMNCGKAVGSNEIPVEVWKCLGQLGVVTLCKLFNRIIGLAKEHSGPHFQIKW